MPYAAGGCPQCDATRLKRLQLDSKKRTEQILPYSISKRSGETRVTLVAVKYAFVMHPRTDIATAGYHLWHATPQDGQEGEDDQAN